MENFEFLVSTNVIFGKGEIKRLLAGYTITELNGVAANPKIESVYTACM